MRVPEASPVEGPGLAELGQATVVLLAVAQAALLALWLGLLPRTALQMGGFPPAPPFFVRWAGVLQVALGLGYALEWRRFRRVSLLVAAKAFTALFLVITLFEEGLPPLLALATFLELALAAAAALLQRPADRSRRARGRLRLVARAAPPVRPAGQR